MEMEKEDVEGDSTLRKKYPDLKGEIISFVLELRTSTPPSLSSPSSSSSPQPPSSSSSLPHHRVGLHLAGHKDLNYMSTYVAGIEPCSLAYRDGRIKVGDELLEVNGQIVYGRSHLNSSAIIKSINGPQLVLVIHRCPEALENMAVVPVTASPIILFQKDLHQNIHSSSFDQDKKEKQKIFSSGSVGYKQRQQQPSEKLSTTVSFPTGMSDAPIPKVNMAFPATPTHPATMKRMSIDSSRQLPEQRQNISQPSNNNNNNNNNVIKIIKDGTAPASVACLTSPRENVDSVEKQKPNVSSPTRHEAPNGDSKTSASRQCSSLLPHSDSLASTDIPFDNEDDDDDDDETSDDLLNHHHQEEILSIHHHHHHLYRTNANNKNIDGIMEENSLKTCSILAGGKAVLMEVDRNTMPLGVVLIGGQDTAMKILCIKEILEGGAIKADGRLQPGDEILEVNGEKVEHLSPSKVQQLMQKSPSTLRLLVKREEKSLDRDALTGDRFFYDSFTIEVFRKLGKGLGICLKSRTGDRGAVVSHIIRGGPAEADGRLSVGDEITTVNGEEVIEAKVLEIFEKIKTMTGRINMRILRLKRSLSSGLQGGSSPSDHSLIGGFRKSFKRNKESNHESMK